MQQPLKKQILEIARRQTLRKGKTTKSELTYTQASNYLFDVLQLLMVAKKRKYEIDNENKAVLSDIVKYFIRDPEFLNTKLCENPSFDKGILLKGNVGSGKTMILTAAMECKFEGNHFRKISCPALTDLFVTPSDQKVVGPGNISKWCSAAIWRPRIGPQQDNPNNVFFDDLGYEDIVPYFGPMVEVMSRAISSRSEMYVSHGVKSHFTTNLTMPDIRKRYGVRDESRLREMCNIITLGGTSKSKDRRE